MPDFSESFLSESGFSRPDSGWAAEPGQYPPYTVMPSIAPPTLAEEQSPQAEATTGSSVNDSMANITGNAYL